MADTNNNKILNVPPLRFPEFSGEWEKQKLSDFVERVTRKNKNNESKLPLTISAQYGLVDQITFFNKVIASADISGYYLLKKGEFAYNKSYSGDYTWGAVKRLDRYEQGALSTLYICFSPLKCVISDYLVHYFETKKWHREVSEIAVEGARNHGLLNIGVADYFNTKHFLPTKKEQKKIAAFLNLIEKRIALQTKIIEDLKTLKSAIIEKLFTRGGDAVLISDLITQVSKRNNTDYNLPVLSVNNRLGFIRQSEQFEDRTVASDDTSNYKVVSVDDFAFNPARINVGSIARLKSETKGIVSPMYICFHTNDRVLPEYFEYFFETKYFYSEMQKRLEGSVRLCLSWEGLCNISISLPNIEQQIEIGKKISTIATKIDLEERYLQNLKLQKQYLLQQMFI